MKVVKEKWDARTPSWSVRDWIMAGTLFLVISGAIVFPALIQARVDATQRAIICQNARAHIEELQALRRVSRALGLPALLIRVPPVPEECENV